MTLNMNMMAETAKITALNIDEDSRFPRYGAASIGKELPTFRLGLLSDSSGSRSPNKSL
jgi:hypothetical protein